MPFGLNWRMLAPFVEGDVAFLLPGRTVASSVLLPTNAEVAEKLSFVALNMMANRCHMQLPLPVGKQVKRLKKIAEAAAVLADMVNDDAYNLFDADIGHAPGVRAAMGLAADIDTTDFGKAKQAARSVRESIDCDIPVLLRILEAAAQEQARRVESRGGPGRQRDFARHDFVVSVLLEYQRSTGRKAGISRPAEGGKRGGPAPRFLSAFCELLRGRLSPDQVAIDPELPAFLRQASEGSGAWVEEAIKVDAQMPAEFRRLRPIREKGRGD